MLVDMLKIGVNNLTLPNFIQRAGVFHDMPLGNLPPLPAITVTMELLQQNAIGIGQNVENPILVENGIWTMPALARRIWRISVVAKDVETREYYRDAVVALYESLLPTVFSNLGQNVSHKFQAHSSQWVEELKDVYPGLFIAEIMVELTGLFDVSINTSYQTVKGVLIGMASTASGSSLAPFLASGLVTG
jgi:hypothetical protein